MNDPITIYRDGRFTTEEAPEWWEAETSKLWSRRGCEAELGHEHGTQVQVHRITGGACGYAVYMGLGEDEGVDVWTPTAADFLDLMTSRVPAFIGLCNGRLTQQEHP